MWPPVSPDLTLLDSSLRVCSFLKDAVWCVPASHPCLQLNQSCEFLKFLLNLQLPYVNTRNFPGCLSWYEDCVMVCVTKGSGLDSRQGKGFLSSLHCPDILCHPSILWSIGYRGLFLLGMKMTTYISIYGRSWESMELCLHCHTSMALCLIDLTVRTATHQLHQDMRQKTQSCFIRDSDSSPHTELGGSLVTTAWRVLRLWREAANILNKQSRTADKGWSSSLGFGRGANNSSP
jgi:hypothetical protein